MNVSIVLVGRVEDLVYFRFIFLQPLVVVIKLGDVIFVKLVYIDQKLDRELI